MRECAGSWDPAIWGRVRDFHQRIHIHSDGGKCPVIVPQASRACKAVREDSGPVSPVAVSWVLSSPMLWPPRISFF